jgi:hypothetical protein
MRDGSDGAAVAVHTEARRRVVRMVGGGGADGTWWMGWRDRRSWEGEGEGG